MLHSTLCYLERDGQYLMLHRVKKQNDANHDKWIGVGGKFEEGESPKTASPGRYGKKRGLLSRITPIGASSPLFPTDGKENTCTFSPPRVSRAR